MWDECVSSGTIDCVTGRRIYISRPSVLIILHCIFEWKSHWMMYRRELCTKLPFGGWWSVKLYKYMVHYAYCYNAKCANCNNFHDRGAEFFFFTIPWLYLLLYEENDYVDHQIVICLLLCELVLFNYVMKYTTSLYSLSRTAWYNFSEFIPWFKLFAYLYNLRYILIIYDETWSVDILITQAINLFPCKLCSYRQL